MPDAMNLKEESKPRSGNETAVCKLNRLALLYEGVFAAICRVNTRRQNVQEPEAFRVRMKQALAEIATTAARRGYRQEDTQEATFAVVAFLDEAMLNAAGASEKWIGETLGQELFDQRSAGELFFKRLDTLRARHDSPDLAEVLEVYYLSLLLGYEGKYAGGAKGELLQLMSNMRDRIDRILGQSAEFSPDKMLPDEPLPTPMIANPLYRQVRLFAIAAFVFALLCYGACSLELRSLASDLHDAVGQRIAAGGVS